MDKVTPITKSQQEACEGLLRDVLDNVDELQPKAVMVLMVTDSDPRFLVMSDAGLSLEGAIAMLQAGNMQLTEKVIRG
jgi:hypothetical protein